MRVLPVKGEVTRRGYARAIRSTIRYAMTHNHVITNITLSHKVFVGTTRERSYPTRNVIARMGVGARKQVIKTLENVDVVCMETERAG